MIVKPKVRGFICVTAHPEGCTARVNEQIAITQKAGPITGPKKVLVIGASTGYGLASRITAAFGSGAATLGVFFERPSTQGRPASTGWYNSVAFERAAETAGLYAKSLNGDAFSEAIKARTVKTIQADLGQVDLIIYSLASPQRIDPKDGTVYKSALKPVGAPFRAQSVNTHKQEITEVALDPATEEEINSTIKVMGGEDWQLWMEALQAGGVLADGAKTVAYSYIGPEVTFPIYRDGTIGKAKENLETTATQLQEKGFEAYVSINKAVVTQASSAIPVVPLYLAILSKVMKGKGLHEDCIEQIVRLFREKLYPQGGAILDPQGRLRLDDWEMKPEVQDAVKAIWPTVTTENLFQASDFAGYQKNFLNLFGFDLPDVDYQQEVEIEIDLPSGG